MNKTLEGWLSLSREELDDIYSNASAGPLPTGDSRGTAIVTGSLMPRTLARFARLFAWQGKVFDIFADDGNSGVLINKITPFSLNFIVAKVYRDQSWLDNKETIAIDYSKTSFFAKLIRDEIRQVEPGLYLGKVWWRKTRILDFALSCPEQLHNAETVPSARQSESGKTDQANVSGDAVARESSQNCTTHSTVSKLASTPTSNPASSTN
ncbi:MAG: hypothetical protein KTR32_24940 [Granulosicoccus sp.]|nr:hypothetical protein [Granulosicoccus sp.]